MARSGERQTGMRWDRYGMTTLEEYQHFGSFLIEKQRGRRAYIANESVMMNASNVMTLG